MSDKIVTQLETVDDTRIMRIRVDGDPEVEFPADPEMLAPASRLVVRRVNLSFYRRVQRAHPDDDQPWTLGEVRALGVRLYPPDSLLASSYHGEHSWVDYGTGRITGLPGWLARLVNEHAPVNVA